MSTEDCCTIDLRLGPAEPMVLNLAASPIDLSLSGSPIDLEIGGDTIDLELNATEIDLSLAGTGPQGPPGSGGANPSFEAINRESDTVVAGTACAIYSTGLGFVRANATTDAKPCVGLLKATVASGLVGAVQTSGPFEMSDWTDITGTAELAPLSVYYLDTTAGKLTTSSPTQNPNISHRIGKTVTPNTLDLDIWQYIKL